MTKRLAAIFGILGLLLGGMIAGQARYVAPLPSNAPAIHKAQFFVPSINVISAACVTTKIGLTSGTSWNNTTGCTLFDIYAIGGGAGGETSAGGGGAAACKLASASVTGVTHTYQIGALGSASTSTTGNPGTATWFRIDTTASIPTSTSNGVVAAPGSGGSGNTGGLGGTTATSIGSTCFKGGDAGTRVATQGSSGGGGAAGSVGAGVNSAAPSSAAGTAGGNGDNGSGGSGGAANGNPGTAGTNIGASLGGGGGGGGNSTSTTVSGVGGACGGGGGGGQAGGSSGAGDGKAGCIILAPISKLDGEQTSVIAMNDNMPADLRLAA